MKLTTLALAALFTAILVAPAFAQQQQKITKPVMVVIDEVGACKPRLDHFTGDVYAERCNTISVHLHFANEPNKTAYLVCKRKFPDCRPLQIAATLRVSPLQVGDKDAYPLREFDSRGELVSGSVRLTGKNSRTGHAVSAVYAVYTSELVMPGHSY